MPLSSSKFHFPNPGDNFGILPKCFKCSGLEVLCNTNTFEPTSCRQTSSSFDRIFFGPCFWLSDECHDPLRAGAKKVLPSKSIFWVTWCSENDCQPSCTLVPHSDDPRFTSSSLKPVLNCNLDQVPLFALSNWGKDLLVNLGEVFPNLVCLHFFLIEISTCLANQRLSIWGKYFLDS